MPGRARLDHVGVTVSDLDVAVEFFGLLGFAPEDRTILEGEFVDTVIGLTGSRVEIVTLRLPEGGTALELSRFLRPQAEPGWPAGLSNVLGLRNVTVEVDDLDRILDRMAAGGYRPVGGVAAYEDAWRMAQVQGPDGILVGLAQRLDRSHGGTETP